MIRTMPPPSPALHLCRLHAKPTNVNAIEAQKRQHRRETARRPAIIRLEHFMHIQRMREFVRGAMSPVPIVKIARND